MRGITLLIWISIMDNEQQNQTQQEIEKQYQHLITSILTRNTETQRVFEILQKENPENIGQQLSPSQVISAISSLSKEDCTNIKQRNPTLWDHIVSAQRSHKEAVSIVQQSPYSALFLLETAEAVKTGNSQTQKEAQEVLDFLCVKNTLDPAITAKALELLAAENRSDLMDVLFKHIGVSDKIKSLQNAINLTLEKERKQFLPPPSFSRKALQGELLKMNLRLSIILRHTLRAGHSETVRYLLKAFPQLINFNESSYSPVLIVAAAQTNNPEMVRTALEFSPNLEAVIKPLHPSQRQPQDAGKTALQISMRQDLHGNMSMASLLVEAGADPTKLSFSQQSRLMAYAISQNNAQAANNLYRSAPVLNAKISELRGRLRKGNIFVIPGLLLRLAYRSMKLLTRQTVFQLTLNKMEKKYLKEDLPSLIVSSGDAKSSRTQRTDSDSSLESVVEFTSNPMHHSLTSEQHQNHNKVKKVIKKN